MHFANGLTQVLIDAHWTTTAKDAAPLGIGEVIGIQIEAGKQASPRCLDGIRSALAVLGLKPVVTPTEGKMIALKVGGSEDSLH